MPYTNQLTPEQVQQILAGGQYGTTSIDGMDYGLSGQEQNNEGGIGFTPQSILGYEHGKMGAGAGRAEYGLNGGFSQMGRNESPSMKDGLVPLLFSLGAAAFAPGGFLASGGGGAAGTGTLFDGGAGAVGGGDALTTASAMGPTTAAASAAGDAALASQLAPYSTGLTAAGGAGSSLLSSLGLEGAGSVMKYAAPLLGGILGSKGVNSSQTRKEELPDFIKQYVTGPGSVLEGGSKLFQQETAPGGMPGYAQERALGQDLLSRPIAGNGFGAFQNKPRFGAPR